MRVAIVYDGSVRDNGTPFLFRAAFAKHLGQELPWYSQAAEIPSGFDFYFHIDDGRDDLIRLPPHPWGFYATDSHLGPEPRIRKALEADIVWCAQKPFAEALQSEGVNAHWLPLACFPEAHVTAEEAGHSAEKVYDVAFVGHLQDPGQSNRIEFLDAMFRAFPSFRFEFGVFHEAMASVYHRARIGINHSVRDDLNMRFFELASIGVPQLCDSRMVGLEELGFRPGEHFIPYATTEDAIAAARFYLAHPEELGDMAVRSCQLVRSLHKYTDRVQAMLDDAAEFA